MTTDKRPTVEFDSSDLPDAASVEARLYRALSDKVLEIHEMLNRECDEARKFRMRLEVKLDSEIGDLHERIGELRQQVVDHEQRLVRLEGPDE
jgi:SMC interacting uncharacterized protein involved in chromosome segregation